MMVLDTCLYRMVAVVVATLCFLLCTAMAQDGVCPACYRGEEPFTVDITRPGFEDQIQCSEVVAAAANLTNSTYVLGPFGHVWVASKAIFCLLAFRPNDSFVTSLE
jgi:hypothetical protein